MLIPLLIICCITPCITEYSKISSVPVFITDTDKVLKNFDIDPNPLTVINRQVFRDVVKDIHENSQTIVVFVEDTLCIEDFTIKDRLGTPFYHLQQGIVDKAVYYIPAVENAYRTISDVLPPSAENQIHVSPNNLKLTSFDQKRPYYYVYFDDSDLLRTEKLRAHDLIMKEICVVLKKFYENFVAIYTSKANPVVVTHRPHKPHSPAGTGVYKSDNIWIKLGGLVKVKINGEVQQFHLPTTLVAVSRADNNSRSIQTNVTVSDFGLSFNFTYNNQKWTLESVELLEANEVVGKSKVRISAPFGRSFACQEKIKIVNTRDHSTLIINDYQLKWYPVYLMEVVGHKGKDGTVRLQSQSQYTPPPGMPGPGEPGGPPLTPPPVKPGSGDPPQTPPEGMPGPGEPGGPPLTPPPVLPGSGHSPPPGGPGGPPMTPPPLGDGPGNRPTPPGSGPKKPTPPPANKLEADNEKKQFSKAETCEVLFSTPILSGLLLSFILLSVLFYAVVSLMNCHSNDRYDDPLGKMLDITEHS